MKHLFLAVIAVLAMASCGNVKEKDIETENATGVVLVQNQSYYEVVLSNGESIFFSGFDEKEGINGIAMDEDSVKASVSYGTGFFISDDGQIATNAHVVSNVVKDKDVNKSVAKVLEALKRLMAMAYNEYDEKYNEAQQAYNIANTDPDVSYDTFYRIRDYRDAIKEERDKYAQYYYGIDEIRASESEIKYHNKVSIAYNNTFVTNTDDFVSCVVTKTDTDHDLAIIQLKDKLTPVGKHVFEVSVSDPLEDYSFTDKLTAKLSDDKNSKVFMTSFNLGPTLALTKEGVKSQFNSGSISQRTDDRLMYSIPSLPGSSGSPVVNHAGQLVAINYAGLNNTQSFNYGVRVKYLKNLMDK